MSNYYDPWAHAVEIFFQRLLQFIFLSLVLGFAIWTLLLHLVFAMDWLPIGKTMMVIFGTSMGLHWRVIFLQCLAISTLVIAWLFAWLLGRTKLRRGDTHHRGTRVVHADRDNNT